VLRTVFDGSVANSDSLIESLRKSVPLLLTGLGVLIAFRAGVWNIGAEGQFIVGGIAAFVAARSGIPVISASMGIAAGMAAGAVWSLFAAWLKLKRNAPEVLTTILLNFVAIHLLGWFVGGPLQEEAGRYPQTDVLPASSSLPSLLGGRLNLGLLLALAAACGLQWLLFGSITGLRLRASGLNPSAAESAGIDVRRHIVITFALSGALSGLAGAIELLGVTHRLFDLFASGYGYAGIAVALVGQLSPLGTIASAFFFGAFTAGAGQLERAGLVSSALGILLQGIVVFALLLFGSERLTSWLAGRSKRRVAVRSAETS
jgi:ABC-type uncharacterized transport system permease subunit